MLTAHVYPFFAKAHEEVAGHLKGVIFSFGVRHLAFSASCNLVYRVAADICLFSFKLVDIK